MTDRVNALVVTLEQDIRIDDVQLLIDAIKMMRFVADVSPNVTDMQDHIAYIRARSDIEGKLYNALRDKA